MSNLAAETLEYLKLDGKSISDIRWIGSSDGSIAIDIDYFFKVAADRKYDATGYGHRMVNRDLVVVGDDWWLSRWEYDGSEGWEFNTKPALKHDHKFGKSVFVRDFNDVWDEMDNLEYLEYEEAKRIRPDL
jgi:hypothetical protein